MQAHFFLMKEIKCPFFSDKSSTNKLMRKIEGRRPKRDERERSLQNPRDSEKAAVGLPLRGSVCVTNS